ncbi:hypothetical protein [Flavobacterium xueshanense]|uniref:Uncharacterized protein n=1 Tax=Flavobacterium xueshanense TaxID=935223 RepID=A0A1I2AHM2_9FLAO|nr:hypothetical protein [Flavobacterium xueshanense]SFE43058.1 hypothetical protein SAMN04488131_1026 [Flavobacterium xueshanense]
MDYFIDNSKSLSDLEKDVELNNQLPYNQLESLKGIFLNGLTTILNRSTDDLVKENKLLDAIRKILVAKKFVDSNVKDFYLKKTLLNSYNALYGEIESTYETFYPIIFVIEDIRSLNNFQKKYSGYNNLLGTQLETKKETTAKELVSSRNEILKILFKSDTNTCDKFIKCEDKLVSRQYLNPDKSKWINGASAFIRFYMYCEKNILRKGVYEKNSRGVQYFRCLYDFHEGKAIDVPSKRKKQLIKSTKHDYNFLDF